VKISNPMYSLTLHRAEKLLRLTWLEGTDGMTDEDFRDVLEIFADHRRGFSRGGTKLPSQNTTRPG
jgi:hypothetical protein